MAAVFGSGRGRLNVVELDTCQLRVREGAWAYAVENDARIARHWEQACEDNPQLFNGDVFIVERWELSAGTLEADLVQTKFAAYLDWRGHGLRDGLYDEAFVTTAVLASDGGMLVAWAVDGTLNEGHYLSPGGFIDARDLGPGRLIDPAGAAIRELAEETGLGPDVARRRAGFLMARDAPYLALASVFEVALTGAELVARVAAHLERETMPELLDPMILRRVDDLERVKLTTPTRLIGAHLLD